MTRITRHKPSPALITSIVALVVAMGGTSYAAIKLPRNSVGSAQLRSNAVTSAKVRNGSLLKQDFKASQLPRGPQGVQGPQGPQGAQGRQGPQGPAGPAGANGATHVVFSDSAGTTVAAGADGSDSVACPDGTKATGGGVFVTIDDEIVNVDTPVTESDSTAGADNQPNGWEGAIRNKTDGDVTLVVEAICASP